MSTLILNVLRSPEHVPAQQRVVHGGDLSIGRSDDCDWSLPDPARSLSRKHCTLAFRSGAWQVLDLSANGTFVNGAPQPIGRGKEQLLRPGDRLALGDYEIEVQIEDVREPAPPARFGAEHAASPFAQAPSTGSLFARGPGGFGAVRLPGLDDAAAEYNPFGPDTYSGSPLPDHVPSSASAFVPPQASPAARQLVPDDWFHDIVPGPAAQPPAVVPPSSQARTQGAGFGFDPGSQAMPFHDSGLPTAALRLPGLGPDAGMSTRAAPLAPVHGGLTQDGLAALLEGSRLSPELVARAAADPNAALRGAGELLRVAVSGIRALLISRSAVKREFRIEQTMLRTHENNPLKFAASDEQALAALLDPRTQALAAVQESIDDLSIHQVAVLAATQAAARTLLEQLAPEKLLAADPGGGLLPGAMERRLWEAYKQRHASLLEQFEDDFESAFGKAFAKAYEQAVARDKD